MAKLVLGPVIGKTTHTTARIGIEVNPKETVKIVLSGEDGSNKSIERELSANRFTVIEFTELTPSTYYKVTIEGVSDPFPGSFTTPAEFPTSMNIASVSCNFAVRRKSTDAWADLRDRFVNPGNLDILLHVGDQIYGDSAFAQAETLLQNKLTPNKTEKSKIREFYRNLYRTSWGYPSTRDVLANVSSLMIWDDHEIRDDWGSEPGDSDPKQQAFQIGVLAHEVFREYQRQLWQSREEWPQLRHEHHCHRWGDIGVIFIDQRGGRSFERGTEKPYLGIGQWDDIQNTLASSGQLGDVRGLIVVTSVPLVYLGDSITNRGTRYIDDLEDHWAFGPHRTEQIEMIRMLRRWKSLGKRELIVIGGDVHIGLKSVIKHHGRAQFKQLVTSPITNSPPPWWQFTGLKLLLESEQGIGDNYSFEHSSYTNKRNYGITMVRISDDPSAQPSITSGIETPGPRV